MRIRYAGKTHVGMKRNHNEDNLMIVAEENLYVVADGMGGHACGEVASQIAVETVSSFFRETAKDSELTWPCKEDSRLSFAENRLIAGIKLANLRIFETARSDQKFKGMGTTIVSVTFSGDTTYVAHVGDSRVYRVRTGAIEQLTEDHSLLNDYKKMAKLTPEEIENFPHKNVIVRALGMKEGVEVDTSRHPPKAGDVFVLCSDGLSGEVPDEKICTIISGNPENLEQAAELLIQSACENGGRDNVTTILIQVLED